MVKNKIMVVEDEIIVAEHIRRSLQNMGYSVTSVASSGAEAIKDAEDIRPMKHFNYSKNIWLS